MYYLEIAANTCTCDIVINGLGVCELNAEKVGSLSYPCNTELVGKENKVNVEVQPVSLDFSTFNKIRVDGAIKRYPDDGVTGPEAGEILSVFSLGETIELIKANPLANIADMIPFQLSAEFDSEDAPSFKDRLHRADVITDGVALMRWAMQFRTMLEQRDIGGLYEMYAPKLADYDIAFPEFREPDNYQWFSNWMQNSIFPQIPDTSFTKDDITLKKWCDGRIWEIRRKDCSELWKTLGEGGTRSCVEVYVGMVNGSIRIVR